MHGVFDVALLELVRRETDGPLGKEEGTGGGGA